MTIEYNISKCSEKLIDCIKGILDFNGLKYDYHGKDRLVIILRSSSWNLTRAINEISNVCEVYGTDYFDLLEL